MSNLNLSEKQRVFSKLIARLILHAYDIGLEITLGEAWRPAETARIYADLGKGIAGSLHGDRLAMDLNTWKDGKYTVDPTDYEELGMWWEQQSTDNYECCWGGRFKDANHYSIANRGLK